jgi:hypothetical protein
LLRDFAKNPRSAGKKNDSNAVAMRLQLLGVKSLSINGWSIVNRATIALVRDDAKHIQVRAAGQELRFEYLCGWLSVEEVSPYHRAQET